MNILVFFKLHCIALQAFGGRSCPERLTQLFT
uniref:Uncharacterized protein n=1 Tax=Anguilla anguilla TaxID=7936 RepID=A0A0E9SM40_ANGAN